MYVQRRRPSSLPGGAQEPEQVNALHGKMGKDVHPEPGAGGPLREAEREDDMLQKSEEAVNQRGKKIVDKKCSPYISGMKFNGTMPTLIASIIQ